jgi:LPXTG-site transpeptidase (sortase) family protein
MAAAQLVLMGCITLGLFTCCVGWQVAQRDISLADLLPRIDRGERADARRHVPATPGAERATHPPPDAAPPAQPAPNADGGPAPGAGEAGAALPPAAAEAPASAVGAAAASSAVAPRGLLATLPIRVATRLVIPSLGVDAPVVLVQVRDGTWDISQITQEVGHLQGTASPGDPSNVVLAGHITLEQGGYGPFKSLAQIKTGETAIVYVGEKQYTYVIRSLDIVTPDNVEIAYPTSEPVLTLITCANWDKAAQRYKDRVVAVGYLAQ